MSFFTTANGMQMPVPQAILAGLVIKRYEPTIPDFFDKNECCLVIIKPSYHGGCSKINALLVNELIL